MGDGSADRYFSGAIDEVRIYGAGITSSQIQNIYLIPPTFSPLTTYTGTPILYGVFTPKMFQVNLVISGITYTTTGDGAGKWKTLPMIT